jgi:phage virion morphogenesis protein
MSKLDLKTKITKLTNNPRLYQLMGEYVEMVTVRAFKTETSPAGQPWTPLKPATIKRRQGKRKGRRTNIKMLRDTRALYDSLNLKISSKGAEYGTSLRVGAIHQYGAPRANIPPRPFMPLDANGRVLPQHQRKLEQIAKKFILDNMNYPTA